MRSYVATRLGVVGRITEACQLYVKYRRHLPDTIRAVLCQAYAAEREISELLGTPVTNQAMLEIGPGQQLVQMAYFSARNEVTAIDLDVVQQRLSLRGCAGMIRRNGWMRTCKTVVRKSLRTDAKVRHELARQLNLRTIKPLRVLPMDAAQMEFPPDRFDVAYSRAVFEHLPDPAKVISEIKRVLKPGGVLHIALHLYTSDTGCHDARILSGQRGALPFWAHLRPEHECFVRPNSYLNKLRLDEWRQLFRSLLPGSKVTALCDSCSNLRQALHEARSRGELQEYSDEELLSITVEAIWKKPAHHSADVPDPRASVAGAL